MRGLTAQSRPFRSSQRTTRASHARAHRRERGPCTTAAALARNPRLRAAPGRFAPRFRPHVSRPRPRVRRSRRPNLRSGRGRLSPRSRSDTGHPTPPLWTPCQQRPSRTCQIRLDRACANAAHGPAADPDRRLAPKVSSRSTARWTCWNRRRNRGMSTRPTRPRRRPDRFGSPLFAVPGHDRQRNIALESWCPGAIG